MKKEVSGKKSLLWLWITIDVVVVVAAVAAVLFATGVLGGGNEAKPFTSELYWNVDRATMQDAETGLSMREPAEDGLFYVRFAVGGEQIELPVADRTVVNKIDIRDVMCLKFDSDGVIIDAFAAEEVYTLILEGNFLQNVEGNQYLFNSSQAYNGMETTLTVDETVGVYNVLPSRPEVPGRTYKTGSVDEMEIMDRVTVYGTDENTPTDIFISYRPYESKVYWRVSDRLYDSANKRSSRERAEDGFWYVDFFVDGEIVTYRTENQAVINAIDGYSLVAAACSLVFNQQGDIVDCASAAYAIRGKLACNNYHITSLNGNTFTATRLMSGTEAGRTYTATITENTKIYNMTSTADVIGEETELQDGDLLYVLSDSMGQPVMIFITNRYVDSPMYFNVSQKYDSKTKTTSRVPDADGWYVIELAVKGQLKKFRTRDKSIVHDVDTSDNRCMGLKVSGDIILKVYDPSCVAGNWSFGNGYFVVSVDGVILSCESTAGVIANGLLVDGCEIYDVSGHSSFKGQVTTLREGDRICAYKNPQGEVTHVYVTARYEPDVSLYWNVNRNASRKPDADGYYVYEMIKMGKTGYVTVKTKDAKIAKAIDTYNPAAMCLRVNSEGIVTKVFNSNAFTIGYEHLAGIHVVGYNSTTEKWLMKYRTTGAEANVDASNVTVYNFSGVYDKAPGEVTTFRPGDRIESIYDNHGKMRYAWVFERESGSDAYWIKNPNWNASAKTTEVSEDGYYYYEVTVNGTVKTVKTKDADIAAKMNARTMAFGMKLDGDIIQEVYSAQTTKKIYTSAYSLYDVTAVNGNSVTIERLTPGSSNTGDKQVINVAYSEIYNVSRFASDSEWGKKTTLKPGDRIQAYYGEDGKTISIIYVVFANTHEAGIYSYCDHCGENVFWHPYYGNIDFIDKHYYLVDDMEVYYSKGWGNTGAKKGYDWVLDLNGHTYKATGSYAFAVRGNSTLSVVDTSKAKTGRITGVGVQIKDKEGNKSEYQSSVPGIFSVLDNGTLNLYGGTYTRTVNREITNLRRAGVAIVEKTGTLNIYDGAKLVNNDMDTPLDLATDGVTEVRRAPQGGALYLNGGTVNIYGGLISNNGKIHADFAAYADTAVGNGGNIFVSSGTLNISGGKITNGWCVGNGGNIYVNGGNVNISGGEISGGTSVNGADNMIIAADKKVNLNITGGTINGGVVVSKGNTLKISGKPQITMGNEQGLYLNEGVVIQVGAMTDGAKVVISSSGVFTADFATEADADAMLAKNIFTPESAKTPIYREGKALALGKKMCINGHTTATECAAADCDKELLDWTPWEKNDSLPTSGNYYLTETVVVADGTTISDNLTLDLNGYNITRNVSADQTTLYIYDAVPNKKLTIVDLSGNATPGTLTVVPAKDADDKIIPVNTVYGLIKLQTGGNVEIYNGIFDGKDLLTSSTATGGIICGGGKLTIHGGTFYGWSNSTGAANGNGTIFGGWSTSELTINDGIFYGGATKQGGMFSTTGKIVINGGLFDGNNSASNTAVDAEKPRTVATHGGLIHLAANNNAALTITGGTFKSAQGANSGGMIYVEANNKIVVDITGGTFVASSKAQNGGFIRFRGNDLNISGVTLEGFAVSNAANADIVSFEGSGNLTIGKDAVIGGGIMFKSGSTVILKDNAQINAGTNCGLKMSAGKLDISGINADAKLAINHTDPTKAFFEAADEATAKALVDNKVVVSADPNYKVIADGKNLTVKVQIQWKEWNAAAAATMYGGAEADNLHLTKLPTAGDYKLIADVTIDARVAMTGNLNLNLNGHTATRVIKSGAADYGFYTTNAKGNLYITDEIQDTDPVATVGTMKTVFDTGISTCAGTGFLAYVGAGYTITIDEGNFDFRGVKTTASATTGCGAIIVDGTLVINGGTFYGANAGTTGFGTVIGGRSANVITINGGTFYGNNAKQGGIISTTGNLTINGGLFDGNTNASNGKVDSTLPQSAATHGGLFYVAKALTITGGEFKAGRVSGSGGIAYVTGSGSVISGGTYTAGGQANYGGFFRFDGSATITGVTLSGGKATTNGNNIAFGSNGNATLTIGQDAVIDGGIMFRSDKTGNKLVLVGNAQVNGGTDAAYSLNLANATVHIGNAANAAVATVGSTFADYIATYDADGNVTGVTAK